MQGRAKLDGVILFKTLMKKNEVCREVGEVIRGVRGRWWCWCVVGPNREPGDGQTVDFRSMGYELKS